MFSHDKNKLLIHGLEPFIEWIEWSVQTVNHKNLQRLYKKKDSRKYVAIVSAWMEKFDFNEIVWLHDVAKQLNETYLLDKEQLNKWAFEAIKIYYDGGGKFGAWK